MSAKLIDWISRLSPISGDARRAMLRMVQRWKWGLEDFNTFVIEAPVFPQPLLEVMSAYEIAVVQRVWRGDFTDEQWRLGTFDFMCGPPDNDVEYAFGNPVSSGPENTRSIEPTPGQVVASSRGPPLAGGEIEPPASKKDMGGWTAGVYTAEQQVRLGVDEYGNAQQPGSCAPGGAGPLSPAYARGAIEPPLGKSGAGRPTAVAYTADQQARLGIDTYGNFADSRPADDAPAAGSRGPRGRVEPPAGRRDMGDWIAKVYTAEQQARLGVDVRGNFQNSRGYAAVDNDTVNGVANRVGGLSWAPESYPPDRVLRRPSSVPVPGRRLGPPSPVRGDPTWSPQVVRTGAAGRPTQRMSRPQSAGGNARRRYIAGPSHNHVF